MTIIEIYNAATIHMWVINLICAFISWFINLRSDNKVPLIFYYFVGCAVVDRMGIVLTEFSNHNWIIMPVFASFEYFIWTRVFIKGLSGRKPKYLIVLDLITVALCLWECYTLLVHKSYLLLPVRSVVYMLTMLVLIYNYVLFAPSLNESYIAMYGILFVYTTFNMVVFIFYNISIYFKFVSMYSIMLSVSVVYYIFYILLLVNQWKIGKTPSYS